MKLLFFDLETTGTNPGKHGIHQISGQIVIWAKRSVLHFIIPTGLQLCRATTALCVWYECSTRYDGTSGKPHL